MDLTIRKATDDDAAAILGILNPIIEAGMYTALDSPFTIQAERDFIRGFPLRGVFHVAEAPGAKKIVGFQTLEPFASYTRAFDHVGIVATFVDMGCQRQGVGQRLAEATFEWARGNAYEKIFTFVRADNPVALRFYTGLGFRIVGTSERQAKIGGKYVDEVIIEKFV